jgi:hypothetical protein
MLGRLELDEGALTVIAEVHHGIEVLGFWVALEGCREPPEERALMCAMLLFEEAEERVEVLAAQGDPDAPDERLGLARDRDFETATNEEKLFVDYAGVSVEVAPIGALQLGNGVVVERRGCAQARKALVKLSAH